MNKKYRSMADELFAGKTLKENVQDIVAMNNTGYKYDELKHKDDDELDCQEELEEIDKTVNLLLHLFISHINQVKAVKT